jgi:4-amino-4-deoxy-L-arabinose transferase-like glycosyltransferase
MSGMPSPLAEDRPSAGAPPAPERAARREELAFAAALAVGTFAYLWGLGTTFIPSIGDEPTYLQIARVTRAAGRLLPLLSETGITNTKPPLLFWQGIAASWAASFDLFWLRLPNVLLTGAAAAVAGALALRISGRRAAALLAAALFLGFRSTIQHGRPFLTNPGETFFLVLPLLLLQARTAPSWGLALACGASLGAGALYKSFALVVPGTLGIALVLFQRSGRAPVAFLRRWGAFLVGIGLLGLAIFAALWLALDPRPDLVWSQFVLGENAVKMQGRGYLAGLVSGPYAVWRLWLSPLSNAGLAAPLVLGLAVDAWRRRRSLPAPEAELWMFVLAFLAFYSIPSQRQENYVLPTCVALATLLALRWDALGATWLRIALVPLALAGLALPVLEVVAARAVEGDAPWSPFAGAVGAVLGLVALAGAVRPRLGRAAFPALAVLALVAITAILTPFGRPFSAPTLAALDGRKVLFPDRFARDYELYRFMAPGADVGRYYCPGLALECLPPATAPAGTLAAAVTSTRRPVPGWEILEDRAHLRQRHSPAEIAAIAGGDLTLLVDRLVILRRRPEP